MSREPARPRARPGQVLSKRLLVVTLLALALAVVLVRVPGLTDLVRPALARVLLVALSRLPRWLRGRSAALDDLRYTR